MKINLYNFQKEYFFHVKKNWLYNMDTGTGKTIMALYHHQYFFPNSKVLIVAPASKIKEGGWQRTIKKYLPQLDYSILSYSMLPKKISVYENYFIIFDEAHNIKNSTGVWGKSAYKLSKKSIGFILLTATPISNGWEDSINYFKMFNLVKNKTIFLNEYALTTSINGYLEILGWKNETKLNNMWNSISKRLDKFEALDLPNIVFNDIYFKKSNTYKKIIKDKIYNTELLDSNMKLRHYLKLYGNLDEKLNYLKNFILSTNENIIIFYNYDEEYILLKKLCNIKRFYSCNGKFKDYPTTNWDEIKNSITLVNYKSGSEGLELTYGTIVIYFSPTDSYINYEQSLGRCYRDGQQKKVTVYRFIVENTVDQKIYNRLNMKKSFTSSLWKEFLQGGDKL